MYIGQVKIKTHIGLALIVSFFPLFGLSCDCLAPESPKEAFEQADKVIVGKVIDATTNWMSGGRKYSFEIKKSWKSSTDKFLIVNSGWDEECGFDFELGKEYLVYTYKKFSLKTDRCAGNKLLSEADEDLAFLGPGNPPTPSKMVNMLYWAITVPVILALIFIAFVVLRKRRNS